MTDGKDGLWDENVGPSLYAKSQGLPVKIWGFFANGLLHYHVLPADGRRTTNMNMTRYRKLVKTSFAKWRRKSFPRGPPLLPLVQDHERCLWHKDNLKALREAGLNVLRGFPKHSPDLNAIEGWWLRLRGRLEKTAPSDCERRAAFIRRLRRTVNWMNASLRAEGRALCTNQKTRASAVLHLKGARCKW
jgi:transposase